MFWVYFWQPAWSLQGLSATSPAARHPKGRGRNNRTCEKSETQLAKGRPMAHLAVWCAQGMKSKDRQEHMELTFEISHPERRREREPLEARPDARTCLEAEREQRPGEPSEPFRNP